MKMTLKEIDIYTSTVERVRMSVESSLGQCSEEVREDLSRRLTEFNELWSTTKTLTEEGDFWNLGWIN